MDMLKICNILQMWLCLLKLQRLVIRKRALTFRRWWVKPHIRNHIRDRLGDYQVIFIYFKLHDGEEFQRFIGMPVSLFEKLLNMVRRKLTKHGPRKPLSAEFKLAIVLSFLHQGGNPQFYATFYKIGVSTMFKLIDEVCFAIKEKLMPVYFPPLNKNTWLKISKSYDQLWNVPHCLGAIDGKHFNMRKPPHSGSAFYNYKNFSIVLMATCDAYRRFTWFNLGDYGSANDASIFNNSDLKEMMDNGDLEIPRQCQLTGSDVQMPYFFVGDNIFALQKHLMKPYNRNSVLNHTQKIFNYRITRARINIECAFGLLVKKWAVLEKDHAFNLKTFESLIVALMCLHNLIITNHLENDEEQDVEEEEIEEYIVEGNMTSKMQRDALSQYFISIEGSVPWQDQYV